MPVGNTLFSELLSGVLKDLKGMPSDDIKDIFPYCVKRTDPPFLIVLSPFWKQCSRRLVELILDIMRTDQDIYFCDDFNQETTYQGYHEGGPRYLFL